MATYKASRQFQFFFEMLTRYFPASDQLSAETIPLVKDAANVEAEENASQTHPTRISNNQNNFSVTTTCINMKVCQ